MEFLCSVFSKHKWPKTKNVYTAMNNILKTQNIGVFAIWGPNNFFKLPLSKNPKTSRHGVIDLAWRDVFGFSDKGDLKKLFNPQNFEHQLNSS